MICTDRCRMLSILGLGNSVSKITQTTCTSRYDQRIAEHTQAHTHVSVQADGRCYASKAERCAGKQCPDQVGARVVYVDEYVERLDERVAERVRHTISERNAERRQHHTDAAQQQYDTLQEQKAPQYLDTQCGARSEANEEGEGAEGDVDIVELPE